MQALKKIFAPAAVSVISIGAITTVHAAVSPEVTAAITQGGADAAVIGAAVLVVIVGIAAFKWLRRAL